MKKIVAGSTAVLLMLTASGALIGCKSTPDESASSSDSSLESTSGVDSAGADAGFDIDGEERETDSSGEGEDADLSDGTAAAEGSSETAREGAQSWITSDGTTSSNREDKKKEGGFGNSYGLASGEGVNGDGVAVMKGGEAGEVDTSAPSNAPNDEENFPSTMERLKNAGKGSASSDGTKADGDGADASAGAGTETASAESGGSRQSAVAPNANDSSTAGLGDRSKNNSGSGSGTGTGGKAANGSASGAGADGTSGGSAKNGNTKNNGSGISGTSSIDGSRNANPTAAKPQAGNKNDKSSGANGPVTGSAAQNGTNKNGTGSGSGSGAQNGNKNGTGAGTGSRTGKNGTGTAPANSGSNKNGSGAGNTTAQNGTNKNASGNGGNGAGTNGSGNGSGSAAQSGNGNGKNAASGTNGTANGNGGKAANASGKDASASSAAKGTNTGKEIAKADGTSGGTGLSTNGSGNAGNGNANASGGKAGNGADGTAAKDRQGMTGDDTTDYVEKFSKWFHPALADVQRCGYFYTTPEICQFDMIQGDFRKVSGYKKAAYGFVFGYSQPDPRGYLSDYIRFEINVDGEYALYTWDGQNYVDLVEPNDRGTAYFYEHPAIYKGYNTLNQIKIEDTGSSYNVYVNGTLIQGNIPYLTGRATKGVMAFFSVAKEHQEDLPKTPVNVGMRITDVKRH